MNPPQVTLRVPGSRTAFADAQISRGCPATAVCGKCSFACPTHAGASRCGRDVNDGADRPCQKDDGHRSGGYRPSGDGS